MKNKLLIVITWHSCSGKSTLRKELQKYLTGYYHIGFDSIKWNLTGYHRDRDIDTVRDILDGFMWVLFEKNIPCITDSFYRNEWEYTQLHERVLEHGYEILTIELRCPEDIRIARFRDRVRQAKAEWSTRISVTDEETFRENMKKPFYFPENSMIFDTSIISTEEISEKIISTIY